MDNSFSFDRRPPVFGFDVGFAQSEEIIPELPTLHANNEPQADSLNATETDDADETRTFETLIDDQDEEAAQPGRFKRSVEWVKRHKLVASMGALTVASAVTTGATGNAGEILENAIHNVPWAGAGLAVSEGAFTAGGAAMLVAAGAKVREILKPRNIFKIRQQVTALNEAIKGTPGEHNGLLDSKLFNTGFVINAIGSLSTMGVGIAAVAESAPPQGWGTSALFAADMVATVSLRIAILKALQPTEEVVGE